MQHYGTMNGALAFFDNRLHSTDFELATTQDRTSALYQATQLIDSLNFVDDKTDPDQELQWPRGGSEVVPQNIERACYLIAFELLVNDVQLEPFSEKADLASEGHGSARANYNAQDRSPHLVAGIPSFEAWRLLLPHLRSRSELTLSRIS